MRLEADHTGLYGPPYRTSCKAQQEAIDGANPFRFLQITLDAEWRLAWRGTFVGLGRPHRKLR